MKRFLVILAVLTLLALVVPAYGVANAKSPKPQDQVKNFLSAAAGLKTSKAAGYWVTGESNNITSQLANVPSGTKISLSKLKLAVTDQTADTAKVTATYTIKIKLKGQKKDLSSNLSDTFNLNLVSGTWLISSTTVWEKWARLVTPSTTTATPTTQTTATTTTTATPAPTKSGKPVKLGGVGTWSGPAAMSGSYYADPCIKLVEKQVKDQGGILDGREVKVIRYDGRGQVAEGVAGLKKLVIDDNVSAIVFGGTSSAEMLALCDAADEYKVLYSSNTLPPGYTGKFAVSNGASRDALVKATLYGITNVVKAKTVAFLGHEMDDSHLRIGDIKKALSTTGIKVVYENYVSVETQDFSSFLTKIKYEKPDFLFMDFTFSEAYINVARQIIELGGWGDIKVGGLPSAQASAIKMPGAEGWYMTIFWFPDSTYPASVKFVSEFNQVVGRAPDNNHAYFYMDLWTPIHAIEMAGTDERVAVAQVATSGKLEWDTPMGVAHWNRPGGFNDLPYQLAHVEKGKLVQIPMTQ